MRNVLEEAICNNCDIMLADIKYNPVDKTLHNKEDKVISIDQRSIEVLELLLSNVGTPVGIETMLTSIWRNKFISKNVVSNKVCLIRSVVRNNSNNIEPRDLLKTYPKKGYYLVPSYITLDKSLEHKNKSADSNHVSNRYKSLTVILFFMAILFLGVKLL